jgi:hypothetical protein
MVSAPHLYKFALLRAFLLPPAAAQDTPGASRERMLSIALTRRAAGRLV